MLNLPETEIKNGRRVRVFLIMLLFVTLLFLGVFFRTRQANILPKEQEESVTADPLMTIESTKNEVFSVSATLDILRKNLPEKEFTELKSHMENKQLTEQDQITIAAMLAQSLDDSGK